MAEFDVAVRTAVRHGRSPVWDSRTDTVLWVDHPAASAHRYSPGRGTDAAMRAPQPVGAALPRARGGLLLHLDDGLALFDADGATRTWLAYWAREGFRATTTAVDLRGRAWAASAPCCASGHVRHGGAERHGGAGQGCGARNAGKAGQHSEAGQLSGAGHPGEAGRGSAAGVNRSPARSGQDADTDGWLVRVVSSGPVRTGLRGLAAPRGLAFDPDGARLYLADGATGLVEAIAFDPDGGDLGARRPLTSPGAPVGGLCVDAAGCPWVALPDAGAVRRYTPEGELDREVALPGHRPTDCCFGGAQLTDLYVTTAADTACSAAAAPGTAPGGTSTPSTSPGGTSPTAGTSADTDPAGADPTAEIDPTAIDPAAEERAALLVVPDAGEGVRTPAFAG